MEKLARSPVTHRVALTVNFSVAAVALLYALVALAQADVSLTRALIWTVIFVACGRISYVMLEHAIHRWLQHAVPPFRAWHDLHHRSPAELAPDLSPFIVPLCVGLYGWLLWLVLPGAPGEPLNLAAVALAMASGSASFGWFGILHRLLHRTKPLRNRYLRALQVHHKAHHSTDGDGYWSVSARWPDWAMTWLSAQWRRRLLRRA
jgi:sterol desaturase/sphingolipid hydroxylase (fatty acid hydroxylase superfamily)